MAVAAETILSVIRFVQRKPSNLPRVRALLSAYARQEGNRGKRSNFPLRRFFDAVKTIGGTITAEGVLLHPAAPPIDLKMINVKEFVPFLRDMVRFQLTLLLSRRSAKVYKGKPGRSDFQHLKPWIDWPATLSLLQAPLKKYDDPSVSQEDISRALTVILTGAQRCNDRLFRHKEPIHPGLPPPQTPMCPWCDALSPETPQHIFWECDAYGDIRNKWLRMINDLQRAHPGDLPLSQWEKTCTLNGLCPEDERICQWLADIPGEDTYPPLPPWVPDPNMPFVSHDGRTQFGTDGGTDMPTHRRLRHSGIGIYGGGASSWQYSSVLRGPIQMNDKAETVAAVILAEAVELQIDLFPSGVEVFIDNEAVCMTAQKIAVGQPVRPSLAHRSWWRRLEEVVERLKPRREVFRFTWTPSHRSQQDVNEGVLTPAMKHLNEGADSLASIAKRMNAPPGDIIECALRRTEVMNLLQRMLVSIHLQRKNAESLRINSFLQEKRVIPLGIAPGRNPSPFLSLDQVRLLVPSFSLSPGGPLTFQPNLEGRIRDFALPSTSRSNGNALSAIKWYWLQLKWPANPAELNRGASWLELTLDFVATTGIYDIGLKHDNLSKIELVKNAFSSLSRALASHAGQEFPLFPCEVGKVSSLAPFGMRNAMEGVKVAPRFLSPEKWVPFLFSSAKDQPAPLQAVLSRRVKDVPLVVPSPYQPLRQAFLRMFGP